MVFRLFLVGQGPCPDTEKGGAEGGLFATPWPVPRHREVVADRVAPSRLFMRCVLRLIVLRSCPVVSAGKGGSQQRPPTGSRQYL